MLMVGEKDDGFFIILFYFFKKKGVGTGKPKTHIGRVRSLNLRRLRVGCGFLPVVCVLGAGSVIPVPPCLVAIPIGHLAW